MTISFSVKNSEAREGITSKGPVVRIDFNPSLEACWRETHSIWTCSASLNLRILHIFIAQSKSICHAQWEISCCSEIKGSIPYSPQ